MTVLLVALGGAVGAALRYVVDRSVQSRIDAVLPWGTLTVNVGGSLLIGVLFAALDRGVVGDKAAALLGVGFCGAVTTYSTFAYETFRLFEERARLLSLINVLANVGAGLGAATAGYAATAAIL